MHKDPFGGVATTLHKLLTEQKAQYRVPEFQRSFVWSTEKELPRFWKYLVKDRSGEGGQPVFLGALVLHLTRDSDFEHPTYYHIIDGQQRLMTLFLSLVAVAVTYHELDEYQKAQDLEASYLLHSLSNYQGKPVVLSSINDSRQFNSILGELKHPKPKYVEDHGPATGSLLTAWSWILNRVRDEIKINDPDTGRSVRLLDDLHRRLLEHTWICVISIRDQANAHQAFQRLNTEGVRLSTIDLVRNAVFTTLTTADSTTLGDFYRDRWEQFEDRLGNRQADYWYSLAQVRNKDTKKNSVFDDLQARWLDHSFTAGGSAETIANRMMDDLTEYVPAYRAITGLEKPQSLSRQSWHCLLRLHRINLPTMTYSFLMELIKHHINGDVLEDDFQMQCEIVESLIARRVLRGIEMSAIHSAFKPLLGRMLTAEALLDEFNEKNRLGTDAQVRDGVVNEPLYTMSRHRYIMGEYERWQKGGKKLDPRGMGGKYHVDHVMPENPRWEEWPDATVADHTMYRHTWGNLVFLTQTENWEKSAKGYQEARPALSVPGALYFRSTGQLVEEYGAWSVDAIRKRSAQLGDWATMRWPTTMAGFQDPERAERLVAAE